MLSSDIVLCALKVEEVNAVEPGLMQDAQRFFVLTQTDNLWKEHLQAIKFLQQVRHVDSQRLTWALLMLTLTARAHCSCSDEAPPDKPYVTLHIPAVIVMQSLQQVILHYIRVLCFIVL